MWIRNKRGDLLNADYMETIAYHDGYTRAWYNGDYQILAEGDVRERIADALRRGDNYLEVE